MLITQIFIVGERNDDEEEVVSTKKRVVKEAFGSGSDSEGNIKTYREKS